MDIKDLKAGRWYKLVAKEGFIDKHPMCNGHICREFLDENNSVLITCINTLKDGTIQALNNLGESIFEGEDCEFFEPVEELKEQPDFWDGESELEAGMLVDYYVRRGEHSRVVYVTNTQVALEMVSGRLVLTTKENLSSLVANPKQEFCKKILTKLQSSHLDFAQDTTWDIKEVAALCWDELKGDG